MTNQYSIEIHNYISERIITAEDRKKLAENQNDLQLKRFYEGQLQELFEIREYLARTVDLKTQRYY